MLPRLLPTPSRLDATGRGTNNRRPRCGVRLPNRRRRRADELVRVDSVNGADPELARKRSDFYALTPVYPQEGTVRNFVGGR